MLAWRGKSTLALELILGEAVQGLGLGGVPAGLVMDRGCPMGCVLLCGGIRRLVGERTAVLGLTGSPLEGLVGHGWEPQGVNA